MPDGSNTSYELIELVFVSLQNDSSRVQLKYCLLQFTHHVVITKNIPFTQN